MKKYSESYFRDKYETLWKRLLAKTGFLEEIKAARKQLDIPNEGFQSSLEFAQYLLKRLSKAEKRYVMVLGVLRYLENSTGKRITENDLPRMEKEVFKKLKHGIDPTLILMTFEMHQEQHGDFLVMDDVITHGKKNSALYAVAKGVFDKYMDVDLLDAHITMHFIEKYLFLGNAGVQKYINHKMACHNCRYIGVTHFSPDRTHMAGKDEGPLSGKYVFNEGTVKMLSGFFDSVFLIIRPYAAKEEVVQYIEDNWSDIKEHVVEKNTFYKQMGVHASRIKESDIEKNRLIYELYKLSKKELLKMYDGNRELHLNGIYKETIISAILEEKHSIQMSADAVKKTATRFATSIEVKRTPKDIRDI